MIRFSLVPAALVLAAAALGGSGCISYHMKPGYPYDVEIGTSEPTEPDDRPGIWFDRERNTATRPNPKPIPNLIVHFEMIKPDGSREEVERPASTSNQGWTFFRGKKDVPEEVIENAKFVLRTKKAGYTNFERVLTYEQVRDASMTIVLAPLDGTRAAAATAAPPPRAAEPAGEMTASVAAGKGPGTAQALLETFKRSIQEKDLVSLRACFKDPALADARYRALLSDPEKKLRVDLLPARHGSPETAVAVVACASVSADGSESIAHARLALRRTEGRWRITSIEDVKE